MRLSDYGSDVYSQFGEDGMVSYIFEQMGEQSRVAVEFGASDGLSCSNTAQLWKDLGWKAVLIEPDGQRFQALRQTVSEYPDVVVHQETVSPTGPHSIASILVRDKIKAVDFMSIDIDGDDFFIWQQLACKPRVVCIEFNPTVPPHIDLRPKCPGSQFGASLRSLIAISELLGYFFIGASHCNAFFVHRDERNQFGTLERDPVKLFSDRNYTYAVTDNQGKVLLVGNQMAWHPREPLVFPMESNAEIQQVTDDVAHLRKGFEAVWGPAWWIEAASLSPEYLEFALAQQPRLLCVDVTQHPRGLGHKYRDIIAKSRYQEIPGGAVLGFLRRDVYIGLTSSG